MICWKKEKWLEVGIENDAHKFFVQRWEELFGERTSDTWQVRACNILSILDELIDSLRICREYAPHQSNLRPLIEEAIGISKRDPVVRAHFPGSTAQLQSLEKLLKGKGVEDDCAKGRSSEEKISLLFRRARVIQGQLQGYRGALIKETAETLGNPPSKYKKELYGLSMALAVELSKAGYSTPFLRESLQLLVCSTEKEFGSRFQQLVATLNGEERSYTCSFIIAALSEVKNWPGLSSWGIRFSTSVPTRTGQRAEEQAFYGQFNKDTDVIASIVVKAFDAYGARRLAYEKLENVFAMMKLYVFDRGATVKGSQALVSSGNGCRCLGPDTSRQRYLQPARQAQTKIQRLLTLVDGLQANDRDKVLAALQYHKLALSAATEEAQLVNLWIGIESLMKNESGPVIDAICKYVPCSMTVGNAYKILKALAIDLSPYWKTRGEKEYAPLSSRRYLGVRDVLEALLDGEQGEKTKALYKLVADNPLLCYRVCRLKDKAFADKTSFVRTLDNNRQNVEWQLRRIYRARNYVIHSGAARPGASQLIQHLHTYLVTVIHNVIFDIEGHPGWGIMEAFEHRVLLFEYLKEKLKGGDAISVSAIMKAHEIFQTQTAPFAWQSTMRPGSGEQP